MRNTCKICPKGNILYLNLWFLMYENYVTWSGGINISMNSTCWKNQSSLLNIFYIRKKIVHAVEGEEDEENKSDFGKYDFLRIF